MVAVDARPPASKFLWVSSGEPHAIRRRELLTKYGDKIRKLYGYDHATAWQVRWWGPGACAAGRQPLPALGSMLCTNQRMLLIPEGGLGGALAGSLLGSRAGAGGCWRPPAGGLQQHPSPHALHCC